MSGQGAELRRARGSPGRGRVPPRRHRLRPRARAGAGAARPGRRRAQAILEQTGHVIGVADATIAIEHGEICVLMGLSGSGKSTLLRCVNRLNKATRGAVLVDDAEGPGRRRELRSGDAAPPAHPSHRHGVPAVRAAALAHGRRRTSASAWSCAAWPGRARPRGRREAQAGQPRPVARQVRPRALGRHAAAGRPRARVRDRRRHPADGRAVLGARPADPQPPAGRAARAAADAARKPSCSSATTSTRR